MGSYQQLLFGLTCGNVSTNVVQALNPLPTTSNEFANVSPTDNIDHEEKGSLESGYIESGDCMSEIDGATSDGTYLETGDEKTDSEDSIAWTTRRRDT